MSMMLALMLTQIEESEDMPARSDQCLSLLSLEHAGRLIEQLGTCQWLGQSLQKACTNVCMPVGVEMAQIEKAGQI